MARLGTISFAPLISAGLLALLSVSPVQASDALAPEETSIEQKVEDLRSLLEMASKEGWVELKSRPEMESLSVPVIEDTSEVALPSATDCAEFIPLLQMGDAPDSYLAQGFLAEAVAAEDISEALGQSLSVLIGERWHNDRNPANPAVAQLDMSAAGACDPALQVWQVLANPPQVLSTRTEGDLFRSLEDLPPGWRERAGVAIALAATERYDFRGAQRVADMLGDSGLFGTPYWRTDPRHILLQARLSQTSNPKGATEYLRYLADRDSDQQLAALDALWDLDQKNHIEPVLDRMRSGTDQGLRQHALQRQAIDAVRNSSLGAASEAIEALINNGADLPDGLIAGLGDQLAVAMESDQAERRIEALDAFMRIEALIGRDHPLAQPRLAELAADAMSRLDESDSPPVAPSEPATSGSASASVGATTFTIASTGHDENVRDRIARFNADLASMREVLSRE